MNPSQFVESLISAYDEDLFPHPASNRDQNPAGPSGYEPNLGEFRDDPSTTNVLLPPTGSLWIGANLRSDYQPTLEVIGLWGV